MGFACQKWGSILLLKQEGDCAMGDLLLSIVVDPVFISSPVKRLFFVTADTEKVLFICLLDMSPCLL